MLAKKNARKKGTPLNWTFATVRVLVVDEGSLVCVQILSSLLSMLTQHAQLQKFIILGEVKETISELQSHVCYDGNIVPLATY